MCEGAEPGCLTTSPWDRCHSESSSPVATVTGSEGTEGTGGWEPAVSAESLLHWDTAH